MKLRSKGICILAGAGPGDIGLVTLRTKEAVEQAGVIVRDYLCITPRFLNRRRRKQELSLTLSRQQPCSCARTAFRAFPRPYRRSLAPCGYCEVVKGRFDLS